MWLKHALFWLIAAFVLFLLVPLFTVPATQWDNARTELKMITSSFGVTDAHTIANDATATYEALFVDTGLIQVSKGAYVTEKDRRSSTMPTGGGLGTTISVTNNYIDTLAAMVYVMLLRLQMLLSWIPFIFPFLIGVCAEGYSQRKIKFAEFGEYGATIFAGAVHFGVLLAMLPVFYMLAPFPISPLFVPVWILVAGWPITIAISNANQILPR